MNTETRSIRIMFPIAACPPAKDSDKEKFNRFLLLQHFTYGILFGKWPTGLNISHFKCDSNGQRLKKEKGSITHKNLIITNHILPDLVPSDNNPITMRLQNITNKQTAHILTTGSEMALFYCDQQFYRNEFIVTSTQSYDC